MPIVRSTACTCKDGALWAGRGHQNASFRADRHNAERPDSIINMHYTALATARNMYITARIIRCLCPCVCLCTQLACLIVNIGNITISVYISILIKCNVDLILSDCISSALHAILAQSLLAHRLPLSSHSSCSVCRSVCVPCASCK